MAGYKFPTAVQLSVRAKSATARDVAQGFTGPKASKSHGSKPMVRKQYHSRSKPFIAYDLETSNIAEGTPTLRYLTAYGQDGDYAISEPLKGRDRFAHLCEILSRDFLTRDLNGYRFVAWNGNGFDVFFIARALLLSPDYVIKPYLTRSKSIRGMKVDGVGKKAGLSWEFLDGMAMTGLDSVKMKLSKFVGLFAPQYPKLELDFSTQEFDPKNKEHVRYAERDSEALYYAMIEASRIVKGLTGNELQPTMGNLGIKYFQSQIPEGVRCWKPNQKLLAILHGPAKRGGYCWIAKQYVGPVWKYDINQAYAAAMRDAELPHGSCIATTKFNAQKPGVYRVTLSREKRTSVPFYYREEDTNAGRFTNGRAVTTWILSTEVKHLRADGWDVEIHEGHYWQGAFSMRAMVDSLEKLRFSDPAGPSGALGTLVKQIGNSAYGKTLEQLGGFEFVMAAKQPTGYKPISDDDPQLENIYYRLGDSFPKVYHQPQIGCFITAHVRIILREAACKAPGHFIYGDTDCVAFSKPVDFLAINPTRYGDWKIESAGVEHLFIAKKVYYGFDDSPDKPNKHAKGLRIRELTREQFQSWFDGRPPEQMQTQRQNFVRFMTGQDMFISQERSGTDVTKSAQAILANGEFSPR